MSPTMENKLLLVGVDFYDHDNLPMRYDVVVVYDSIERDFLTKRIIGLPGEIISVIDGLLFINGEELVDDLYGYGWFDHVTFDMYPQEIPYDMYYVIGDNREDSVHGLYLYDEIVGRVLNVE
jgi:signal peptidase I